MIKYLLTCFVLAIAFFNINCSVTKKRVLNSQVRAVNFTDNLRSIIEPNFEKLRKGSVYYYYKNYKVLETEVINTDLSVSYKQDSVVIGDSTLSAWVTKKYFIFKQGYDTALIFESEARIHTKLVPADSILKRYGQGVIQFNPNACIILRNTKKGNGFLDLSYEICERNSINSSDSIYYFFSTKLKGIEFSFDKKLDQKYGMKLCKMELIYHSLYKSLPKENIGVPRVFTQEMKEIKVDNPSLIISLCERYEKEINNK